MDKDQFLKRLRFLFKRTSITHIDTVVTKVKLELDEELKERNSRRRVSDHVDDSQIIWLRIQRQRKINELADKLALLIKDGRNNEHVYLDEEDVQDAIERCLQKVF